MTCLLHALWSLTPTRQMNGSRLGVEFMFWQHWKPYLRESRDTSHPRNIISNKIPPKINSDTGEDGHNTTGHRSCICERRLSVLLCLRSSEVLWVFAWSGHSRETLRETTLIVCPVGKCTSCYLSCVVGRIFIYICFAWLQSYWSWHPST